MSTLLKQFIAPNQLRTILSLCRGEEGDHFRTIMKELDERISTMPKTYEQEGNGDDAIVYLHYFTGGCDWFIYEKDSEPEQQQAFGLADLFGDGGELGYISIIELLENDAELDLYWTPKTLGECRKLQAGVQS